MSYVKRQWDRVVDSASRGITRSLVINYSDSGRWVLHSWADSLKEGRITDLSHCTSYILHFLSWQWEETKELSCIKASCLQFFAATVIRQNAHLWKCSKLQKKGALGLWSLTHARSWQQNQLRNAASTWRWFGGDTGYTPYVLFILLTHGSDKSADIKTAVQKVMM